MDILSFSTGTIFGIGIGMAIFMTWERSTSSKKNDMPTEDKPTESDQK